MTDYTELVKALRETATFTKFDDLLSKREQKLESLAFDAAAAIEALQAEVQFYDALAEEWQSAAENKERLLGLYRAEQAKHFYSAMDDNGRIIATSCVCMNIPVFPDSSEIPNS